jgi:hypothetical protein
MCGTSAIVHAITRRIVALGIATGVGCATAPPKRDVVAPPAERASVIYGVPIAPTVPLPLVRGSVAGKPTLMVVDTGTGGHVVAAWLARSLGLSTTKHQATHDPSGRPVGLERLDEPHLVIDGFDALPDGPTGVVDLPAGFERAGIGAIISPQALASASATVILDMPHGEMRRVRSSTLAASAAAEGTFEIERPVVCVRDGGEFFNRTLTATAIIAGVSTVLEVDTGAVGSPFFVLAQTEAGRNVLARPGTIEESGLSAAGRNNVVSASGVPVRIGLQDRLTTVTVLAGARDAGCGVEGRLGLDWLRACVFTIGEREYRLRCNERLVTAG